MWNSGTIFITRHVSSEEFNDFCRGIGGIESNRCLDPPHEDQIEFIFFGEADNATKIVKLRDRDRCFYLETLDVYHDVLDLLKGDPQTFLEITITDKQPSRLDCLNYYQVCSMVMNRWEAVLSDLDETALNSQDVESKVEALAKT